MAAKMRSGCRIIPRANALALQGYRHCCHVMLHCPVEAKLFGFYPVRHIVLMQLRFDGRFGFPGGFVDDGEDLETAINREVVEELGNTSEPVDINKDDYIISHLYEEHVAELNKTKRLCLHFFTKKVPLEQFLELEKRRPDAPNLGFEAWYRYLLMKLSPFSWLFLHTHVLLFHSLVNPIETVLGVIRCPLYIMADKQSGLPSFLRNNFVGNSRQQLLIGLEHASILSQEEIKEAVHLSQLIQGSTPKL